MESFTMASEPSNHETSKVITGIQLPPEIIHSILSLNDISPLESYESLYGHWPSKILNLIQDFLRKQEDVASTCLISRSWNVSLTDRLYEHIILSSPRQVHLFSRTVRSNHSLRAVVKTIFFVDSSAEDVNLFYQSTSTLFSKIIRKTPKDMMKAAVRSIISDCPSLFRLTIHDPSTFRDDAIGSILIKSISSRWHTRSNLRVLILNPMSLYWNFGSLSFPSLEFLSIRHAELANEVSLPHLPRLHTLQFITVDFYYLLIHDLLSPTALPCIRELGLYNCRYARGHQTPFHNGFRVTQLTTLQRLDLVGDGESVIFDQNLSVPQPTAHRPLQGIRHISLGYLDHVYLTFDNFTDWVFDEDLETLEVLVTPSNESITKLQSCLAQRTTRFGGVMREVPDRELNLNLAVWWKPSSSREMETLDLDSFRRFCDGIGVNVHVGFGDWMTSRLNSYLDIYSEVP